MGGWYGEYRTLTIYFLRDSMAGNRYYMKPKMIRIFSTFILLLFLATASGEEKKFDLGGGLTLHLEEREFISSDWDIEQCPGTETICRINGRVPFGVDGSTPKQYLHKLAVTNGDQVYLLDTSNMFNAWGNRPLQYRENVKYFYGVCHNIRWCTFRGIFSDGAGSFVAEWQVRDGLSERTIITGAQDIVHLFITHIEPPIYK